MDRTKKQLLIPLASALLLAATFAVGQDADSKPPEAVVQLLVQDVCKKGCSNDEVTRWKENLKFEKHDLNRDSVPELFLYIDHSDWCGAGANCDYWIFQETRGGYKLLLSDKELRIKETVTNGYRDLVSETPMGFCDRNVQRYYVTPYKYDGQKYRKQPAREECLAFTPPSEP